MKTLVSAETVRQAHARGDKCLPGGKDVLVTPEARGLAEQLGLSFSTEAAPAGASNPGDADAIRAAVLARVPADVAGKAEVVEQIVGKVRAAQQAQPPASAGAAAVAALMSAPSQPQSSPSASNGIKRVGAEDVRLGVFPGAGADKQFGIADVITSADGAPMAAGVMAWSQCFFPWTLDYDEIDLVLEGELHIRCQGQTTVGKPGDVLFIPKGSAIEFGTPSAVRFFYVTYPADWQG